jgi:hypothetical protein
VGVVVHQLPTQTWEGEIWRSNPRFLRAGQSFILGATLRGLPSFFVDGVVGTPHSSSTTEIFTSCRKTMDYGYLGYVLSHFLSNG